MAVARAPHLERQAFEFDMAEARLEQQQRTPRKGRIERRQFERELAVAAVQAHALQAEFRARLLPGTRHGVERDALPERARHQRGDAVAVVGDIGQDPEIHQRRRRCRKRGRRGRQPCAPAQGAVRARQQKAGESHRAGFSGGLILCAAPRLALRARR